jgi:MFS family permease
MTGEVQRRALTATALGWGLDSFDFYLYVYALPAILSAFGLTKAQGGLLGTYTLVASAIGGIAMGTIADRIGRRTTLMISIAWYAFFTFLSGFAQNYEQLAIFRALEGLGFGGEWAVGSVLIAEWASAHHRGRTLGFMQGAWAVGWFAANLAFQLIISFAGPDPGWRYLFFLGLLPAAAVLYVRRNVVEPPVFTPQSFTLPRIFAPHIVRTTVLASLLAVGTQTGYYAIFTWMPAYLTTQRHIATITGGNYLYLLIFGAFVGYVTAGYINDAIGRRRTFMLFSVCCALIVPLYLYVVVADWQLLIAGPILGYFASGIFSGFGPYLSELFPNTMRCAAQGFCYNFGRGVAGIAPFAVGHIAARQPIGTAMMAVALCAYTLAIVAVSLLPETKGVTFESEAAVVHYKAVG